MASHSKTVIFNITLAVLAGAAGGFAAYAMPRDLLESLVAATGLSNLTSAALPPLGTTARLGFVLASAVSLATLVWLLLSAFDRPAPRSTRGWGARYREDEVADWVDSEASVPTVRTAAPAVRPLRALELDETTVPLAPLEEPLELETRQISRDDGFAKGPWSEPLPETWDPAPMHLQAEKAEEELTTARLLDRLPSPQREGASVSSLVQRLNAGLTEGQRPVTDRGDEAQANAMDDRLRNVLHDLQNMAGSNH